MKNYIEKINGLHELHTEAARRKDYHVKQANQFAQWNTDIAKNMFLNCSAAAHRYDRLTRYIYIKLVKAIKELNAALPVDRLIYTFDIDGQKVTINNERQAERLTQKYPNANVQIHDWLTNELLDEAPADAIFNVEPKLKQS